MTAEPEPYCASFGHSLKPGAKYPGPCVDCGVELIGEVTWTRMMTVQMPKPAGKISNIKI